MGAVTVWEPDPGWQPMPGGRGGARLFAARGDAGAAHVVKRLDAPTPDDPGERSRPDHVTWWRREADVALDGGFASTDGVRAPRVLDVEEDEYGVTLRVAQVEPVLAPGPFLARALGVLASQSIEARPWWARHVLADRTAAVEARGGWSTLARTTLADVADRLWARRGHHVGELATLTQVPGHGDPTPENLSGRVPGDNATVLGLDWACAGSGAVGADLGYLALSCREDLDTLLSSYLVGLDRPDLADAARQGAVVTACYTALHRAESVLASAARGPGALAGKYRHPAVAPSIRTLQRLFPHLETLL